MIIMNKVVCAIFLITISRSFANEDADVTQRKGKIFPVFSVVRFPNTGCTGDGQKNGTCYTTEECNQLGGVASGTCANSYGICCIFAKTCGGTSSQNCTYLESPGTSFSGPCTYKICPCSSNICQLRLDFGQFVISGPSTSTVSTGLYRNGIPLETLGSLSHAYKVTTSTQCLTDTFSVTNPDGQSPAIICGTNNGEHMYIDASDACNSMDFLLGSTGIGTSLATRKWSIKVTQYDCNYQNLAPPGCTQYFFGTNIGTVQTFNYQGGKHLANQDQNICVRQERSNCRICWTTDVPSDFQVGNGGSDVWIDAEYPCCNYATAGSGGDCATFPGARTTKSLQPGSEQVCGNNQGLAVLTAGRTTSLEMTTVCSQTVPFSVRFLSDDVEVTGESLKGQIGFKLTYIQTANNC